MNIINFVINLVNQIIIKLKNIEIAGVSVLSIFIAIILIRTIIRILVPTKTDDR